MEKIILNKKTSIVLPLFDTTSILGSKVNKIILSLYLLNAESLPLLKKIHLTINPFNPDTREVKNGVSVLFRPKVNAYNDFLLPRELFEKMVSSNELLLLRMVDVRTTLVFAGPDIVGTSQDPQLTFEHVDSGTTTIFADPDIEGTTQDPQLTFEHTDSSTTFVFAGPDIVETTQNPQLTFEHADEDSGEDSDLRQLIINNNFTNITNTQVHYGTGDNIGGNKTESENGWLSKFFWYFIIPLLIALIIYILTISNS